MDDLISRQAAIDALNEYFARIGKMKRRGLTKGEKAISLDTIGAIKTLPSAQPKPTLHGYPIEHLEMIARVMAKENCTPEDVARLLQNTGEIARMVRDEMMEMLKESIGRSCKGVENEVN